MATVLAVDTGTLNLMAGGSVAIGNIVNPAEIKRYSASSRQATIAMTTYGPSSAIGLATLNGDVMITPSGTLSNQVFNVSSSTYYTQTYPAILGITAFGGSITTPQNGMVQMNSPYAALNLYAENSIDLHGGVEPGLSANGVLIPFGPIASGASLIDLAFNPYAPNMCLDNSLCGTGAFSAPVLAHAGENPFDPNSYDHIYAVTGDISGAGIIQIPRPVVVHAGNDIVNLNLTAQNVDAADVSQVIAGRDISYTGSAENGGLQIAGPGYLDVEAGRNLGPFLPASADIATGSNPTTTQEGIVSSGNAAVFKSLLREPGSTSAATTLVPFPVGNFPLAVQGLSVAGYSGAQFTIGLRDAQFVGANDLNNNPTGQRNFLLTNAVTQSGGATIVALFGVGKGANYDGVVAQYINPAVSSNYLSLLQNFLSEVGITTSSPTDAWSKWGTLSAQLQHIFVDKVFFAQLATATSTQAQRGYDIVNTMFPASAPYGYTANNLSGGTNGAPLDQLVKTGNLDLLHSTIQTEQGGDILIFGPGGQITVGSVASEPNSKLKLNNIGILTLANGSIDAFADRSILVNSSRIFTEFGGDILLWSSNGDINAGRGARTTVSFNPLQVIIDNTDYQSVDPNGFVSGAGIATLQTTPSVPPGNATLLAPNGTVDAGDAGLRVSGNLIIVAPVVLNGDNIKVGGTSTGVPTVTAPSLGGSVNVASTDSGNSATRAADTAPTGSTDSGAGTVIIVEVLGYGGGDNSVPSTSNINEAPPPTPGGSSPGSSSTPGASQNSLGGSEDDSKKKSDQ